MTEQLKAEAYVRKQRPALYKPEYSVCSAHQIALDKECDTCQSGWMSPNLQDWLAVLGDIGARIDYYPTQRSLPTDKDFVTWDLRYTSVYGGIVMFNLTTGQPATQADFKAFNEIVK